MVILSSFTFSTKDVKDIHVLQDMIHQVFGDLDVTSQFSTDGARITLDYYELEDEDFDSIFDKAMNLPENFVEKNPNIEMEYDCSFDVYDEMFYSISTYKNGQLLSFKTIESEDFFKKGHMENGQLVLEEVDEDTFAALGGNYIC